MSDPLWLLLIGLVVVVGGILGLRLHAFLSLLLAAFVVAALTPAASLEQQALARGRTPEQARREAQSSVGSRVAAELGNTAAKIAILIAMAAIIGKCMLDSGAADRIVRSSLRAVGEERAPFAFLGTGFFLGIPVFFDTVLYLMIPLAKALVARTRRHYTLMILSIIAGTTMAHSLVPPTPGPLLAAAALNVPLGTMIWVGGLVGAGAALVGFAFATWINRRMEIPLRESPDVSLDFLARQIARPDAELPPLWLALLPIALPVVLITGDAVARSLAQAMAEQAPGAVLPGWLAAGRAVFGWIGDQNVALLLAAAVAMLTLVIYSRASRVQLAAAVQDALSSGGIIILITAAGGAFGGILQQTGIAERIQHLPEAAKVGVLPVAFLVTALVRTAQGSATVAMITAVGILEAFGDPARLGYHPVYVAVAIGCGSKLVPWMNDSGFWIVCKMSGFTEAETLKTFSVMLTIMGIVGLLLTIAMSRALPLT